MQLYCYCNVFCSVVSVSENTFQCDCMYVILIWAQGGVVIALAMCIPINKPNQNFLLIVKVYKKASTLILCLSLCVCVRGAVLCGVFFRPR